MIMPWKSSIDSGGFKKLTFLDEISNISKNLGFLRISSREALLLYELSERDDGSPLVAIRKQ